MANTLQIGYTEAKRQLLFSYFVDTFQLADTNYLRHSLFDFLIFNASKAIIKPKA